jgi:mannose-6-phosphate isomerase-like protein (cupin superfamily)
MSDIQIIKTGIDVSSVVKQLHQYHKDWECQKSMENTDSLIEHGYPVMDVGVLQLKIGVVSNPNDFVGDSEYSKETPAWHRHTAVRTILRKNGFKELDRCGFLTLPVGGEVGFHIDEGYYYQTRDRYHLSIAGTYLYECGDSSMVIEAGTLFWFNNKKKHSAKNIGNSARVTFVFDVKGN